MQYVLTLGENKQLTAAQDGGEPVLVAGEKGVDSLLFCLPATYRGLDMTGFSFYLNAETPTGSHKLALSREDAPGRVCARLDFDGSSTGLCGPVAISLEARDASRVLCSRQYMLQVYPAPDLSEVYRAGQSLFDTLFNQVNILHGETRGYSEAAATSATAAAQSADAAKEQVVAVQNSAQLAVDAKGAAQQIAERVNVQLAAAQDAATVSQGASDLAVRAAQTAAEPADRAHSEADRAENAGGGTDSGAVEDLFLGTGTLGPNLLKDPSFEGSGSYTGGAHRVFADALHGRQGMQVSRVAPLVSSYSVQLTAGQKYLFCMVARGRDTVVLAVGDEQFALAQPLVNGQPMARHLLLFAPAGDCSGPLTVRSGAQLYVDCMLLLAVPDSLAAVDEAGWLALLARYPYTWGAHPQPPAVAAARQADTLRPDLEGLAVFHGGVPVAAVPDVDYPAAQYSRYTGLAAVGDWLEMGAANLAFCYKLGRLVHLDGVLDFVPRGAGDCLFGGLPYPPAGLVAGPVCHGEGLPPGFGDLALCSAGEGALQFGLYGTAADGHRRLLTAQDLPADGCRVIFSVDYIAV